ncbi:MAG: Lhr family helicase, partial [bacterium]
GEDEAIRSIVHGWIQVSGPVSVPALASRIGVRVSAVEIALAALEGTGIVLRGRFTPGAETEEWCERGLLARIHRLTVGRLRKEIEAVTPADFMRFLLRWHHVQRGTQLHGRDGLAQIIGQLQGLELPAPAWEEHVLPSRIRLYDPADLEYLSLSGMVTWGRLTANGAENGEGAKGKKRRRQAPGRNSPIAFVMREDLPYFLMRDQGLDEAARGLSSAARDVLGYLEQRGASFMADIIKNVRRMPVEVEDALWELVSHGFVSGDGVAGLRQLMHSGVRERGRRRMRMMALRSGAGLSAARPHTRSLPVGRWALWQPPAELDGEERGAAIARQLLRRYGVVFRDVLVRERIAPAWRVLLDIYRRWEAQGEIRGGRFVSGFVGEQFALPEAVEALRAVRRSAEDSEPVVISAADPLNLVGIILPGVKVSPFSGMGIAYKNGAAEDVAPMGALLSRLRRPPASVS